VKAKLGDVAKEAGVSIATVSRVLNAHPVSPEARKRVEEAIANLGYRPNLTARGLIQGKSFRIGVILSNMENPYFSLIMNSMELRLRSEGYLCNFASSSVRKDEEVEIIQRFLDSGIDGLIVVDVDLKKESSGLYADLNRQIPVVLINGNPSRTDTNCIMVDQELGMWRAMDYLFSFGHREIAFVRGSHLSHSFDVKERVFRARMEERGFPVPECRIITIEGPDNFSGIDEAHNKLQDILKSVNRPTAIFCCNEIMALGALKAAKLCSVKVPDDLSIIAQDNTILSRISDPELTTLDMNPSRLGKESAEMMLQLLSSENPSPRRLVFFPDLIIRDSCAPCP